MFVTIERQVNQHFKKKLSSRVGIVISFFMVQSSLFHFNFSDIHSIRRVKPSKFDEVISFEENERCLTIDDGNAYIPNIHCAKK